MKFESSCSSRQKPGGAATATALKVEKMKYYVSEHTAKAIKDGMPMCDVYMPRNPQGKRTVAVNIEVLEKETFMGTNVLVDDSLRPDEFKFVAKD